uniref:Transposase n=1 Tax=Globodera rostochiensis TaxID=31243 RepID=A0A914HUB0_GLORO
MNFCHPRTTNLTNDLNKWGFSIPVELVSVAAARPIVMRNLIAVMAPGGAAQGIEDGKQTITDWTNFFRDICAEYFVRHSIQIGGQGIVVEIDETCIVRRKYNRGRLRGNANEWLFGGVERGTNGQRAFMVPVLRRRAQDLLPLIEQYIAPGCCASSLASAAHIHASRIVRSYLYLFTLQDISTLDVSTRDFSTLDFRH